MRSPAIMWSEKTCREVVWLLHSCGPRGHVQEVVCLLLWPERACVGGDVSPTR